MQFVSTIARAYINGIYSFIEKKYNILDNNRYANKQSFVNSPSDTNRYGMLTNIDFFLFSVKNLVSDPSNMLFNDNHLLINLIMIEILGTIFFLGVITICIYLRRYFVRKSLAGCTALVRCENICFLNFIFKQSFTPIQITNGDSSIAQELATQLTSRHNCRVVLLKQATGKTALNANPNGVSVFNCNILDNADLEQISQQVSDLFDGIDIVIDNGITEDMIPSQDCREFVETTGERLRATINVSLLQSFKIEKK